MLLYRNLKLIGFSKGCSRGSGRGERGEEAKQEYVIVKPIVPTMTDDPTT
jgi:hypothetical protein